MYSIKWRRDLRGWVGLWINHQSATVVWKRINGNSGLEVSPGLSFLTLTLPFDQRLHGIRNHKKVYCQRWFTVLDSQPELPDNKCQVLSRLWAMGRFNEQNNRSAGALWILADWISLPPSAKAQSEMTKRKFKFYGEREHTTVIFSLIFFFLT